MSDQLYLSLWYPNFRFAALPAALIGVLKQFAVIAKDGDPKSLLGRVAAASVYPIDWTESPIYQRIYNNLDRSMEIEAERVENSDDTESFVIENAVAEATEQLHEDQAYEFEMRWLLWQPENEGGLDPVWRLEPAKVKIIGFGPDFDAGAFEQNGQVRIDFGLDTPWVQEDEDVNADAAKYIQKNVEKLLAFTLSVEKHCGISSRLLWTESGEPLAEKLIARLQRLN